MKDKLKYIITVFCFLAFIFAFTVAGILYPDREFSETENRTLQQFPEFSIKNLKEGKFTSDFDTYMSDQIFMKDTLVTAKTDADRLLMKNYQNGVYFGKDGYYLQDYKENRTQLDTNIGCINDFADKIKGKAQISFMLVPNAISVMSDKLPVFNQTDDQKKSIDYVRNSISKDIDFYCPYNELENAYKSGTQVFCRTDHHWTPEGAKIGFDGLMKNAGETVPDVKYEKETLQDFYGTLYSKAPSSQAVPDSINLYKNKDNNITVTYTGSSGDNTSLATDKNITSHSLFADEFKTKKDKYKTFLGGNFDMLTIDGNAEKDENVLIVKDSYANCTLPYFADKYSHITVMDMRYYHLQEELTVSEYIEKNDISKVFFIYNMDFLNSDMNFTWLD